jgi:hypothetical protein
MYIRSITNIKQLKEHQILLETEKELIEELCKVKDSIKAQKNRNKKRVCLSFSYFTYCNFALGYYQTINGNKMKKPLKQIQSTLQSFFTDDKTKQSL